MRILEIQKAEVLEEIGKTDLKEIEIDDVIFGITVERLWFYVGEGLYAQNTTGGLIFFPIHQVGKCYMIDDSLIPNPALPSHY